MLEYWWVLIRASYKFGNTCPSSGVSWIQTWQIIVIDLMLLHHWLHQIVSFRFQPNFGNGVTDGLIRHATSILYPFYWNRKWSTMICFAFKVKRYARKKLFRSRSLWVIPKNCSCCLYLSFNIFYEQSSSVISYRDKTSLIVHCIKPQWIFLPN